MRLPTDQIKAAILHPDRIVRDVALYYFTDSFSQDHTIMPLVIQAVEAHDWNGAFEFYLAIKNLAQTEDSLLWLLRQLEQVADPKDEDEDDRRMDLSDIVADASLSVLQLDPDIAASTGLFDEDRQAIIERLELATADPVDCWRKLEDFCEANKKAEGDTDLDLPHAYRLVEAIGRSQTCADRVLAVLSHELDDYTHTAAFWLEPLAARAAGLMRLKEAVPLLIGKLRRYSDDVMDKECGDAFIRIGTDEVVEAICMDFHTAPWPYRLGVSRCLGHIHTDLAVSKSLYLLGHEEDSAIQDNLIASILGNFSPEGIEPARQAIIRGSNDVRHPLVAVATLLGVTFPELEAWRKTEEECVALRRKAWEELDDEMPFPDEPAESPLEIPYEPPAPIVRGKKIGRNDPCPCGSGKKYKKCCLGKD